MDISLLFISLGSMGGIGLALALILVMADKKLAVKEDPRTEKALEVLPGSNCGACGYGGCAAFARALTEGKVSANGCRAGGSEVAEQLAEIMGEKAEEQKKKVARVFCSGGEEQAVKDKVYTGVRTCTAANLVGAEKACTYSCIGYGDCVTSCPFEAIYMGENGLPVIDLSKCTGCGECVEACPRNVIQLTEADEVVHVYCRSLDKGAVVRKICKAGCIACKRCEKDDNTGAVKVEQNLAVVDYSANKAPVKSTGNCPTGVIRVSEPAPGYEEYFKKAAQQAEKLEQG